MCISLFDTIRQTIDKSVLEWPIEYIIDEEIEAVKVPQNNASQSTMEVDTKFAELWYLVKWKDWHIRDSTWEKYENIKEVEAVDTWRRTEVETKAKRKKLYRDAVNTDTVYEQQAQLDRQAVRKKIVKPVLHLNRRKLDYLCMTPTTLKKGIRIAEETSSILSSKRRTNGISAWVKSSDHKVEYRVSVTYNPQNANITGKWCGCQFWKANKEFLCKHLVAVLYQRIPPIVPK